MSLQVRLTTRCRCPRALGDPLSAGGTKMSEENLWPKIDRATVENYAAGRPRDASYFGPAKAELLRRDQEYAEEQERSRRNYEDERAATRREFEEQLAQRQMDHASGLAKEQLDTARAAAKAAQRAAWAAAAAAFGAIAQAIIAAVK
jgi:hypothetical protein